MCNSYKIDYLSSSKHIIWISNLLIVCNSLKFLSFRLRDKKLDYLSMHSMIYIFRSSRISGRLLLLRGLNLRKCIINLIRKREVILGRKIMANRKIGLRKRSRFRKRKRGLWRIRGKGSEKGTDTDINILSAVKNIKG